MLRRLAVTRLAVRGEEYSAPTANRFVFGDLPGSGR
jgi:hypothetical protein